MIPMDCHTHTSFSPDGTGTAAERVYRACAIGLPVLAITEHVEMNRFFSQGYYAVPPRNKWEVFSHDRVLEQALDTLTSEKEKAATLGVTLLAGMEMGQPNADFALSEIVQRDRRLDMVIASLHELLEKPDFFCLDYQVENSVALLESYFEQLYTICQWGKFDVLGHLTYPLRYMQGEAGIHVDLEPYAEVIRSCFRALIDNGCALEINTSGFRQAYAKPFPTLAYIRWYREMGGELLTLGSDAHCDADLGKDIEKGVAMARAAGFSYLCYFQCREPVFVSI